MSKENLAHLNTNTLIGHTDQRGTAWHYRAEHQGEEPNHYPGPIPVFDVHRRLFNWHAQSCKLAVQRPTTIQKMTHLDEEHRPARWVQIPDKQAITRSDTGHVMGIFSPGYLMHAYDEWLLNTVAKILYNDLSISSAGLLKNGAIAWVEVSVPKTIHTPEGFDFRPNLLATTSFDGSIATTFKRTITAVVCDNTRAAALGEQGGDYKVKHSRYSHARLAQARAALLVVHQLADDFTTEIRHLTRMDVTTRQWDTFLDLLIPSTDQKGHPLTGRAKTTAQDKKETIDHLYKHDPRAEPWTGTALGVLQAVNTYDHHHSHIRGTTRAERNMLRTVKGDFDAADRSALLTLSLVLQA